MKRLMIVSSNQQYIPYLNALLNSVVKYKLQDRAPFDVLVLTDTTMPNDYIEAATTKLPYNIRFKEINDEEANLDKNWSGAWKCKAGRYHYLKEEGKNYDVCCLMDADLYITNAEFVDFFGLVAGTRNLIGCNERFKWNITDIYTLNGKPILEPSAQLYKFHCNVPLFLDTKEWEEVIEDYRSIIFRGRELREGEEKVIGDLYSWNIAVYRQQRQSDVMLAPMQSMTQVHRTGYRDKNCLIAKKKEGYWMTGDGDPVYCLHGRPDREGFRSIENKKEFQKHKVEKSHFLSYSRLAEKEWLDVNFNYAVDLRKVYQHNTYWNEMGK